MIPYLVLHVYAREGDHKHNIFLFLVFLFLNNPSILFFMLDLHHFGATQVRINGAISIRRLRCGEFLLLLIGHVNGRDRAPLASVHEDIRHLFVQKSASLIWAASQFGSTLDHQQRLIALQIQARRVLESWNLY